MRNCLLKIYPYGFPCRSCHNLCIDCALFPCYNAVMKNLKFVCAVAAAALAAAIPLSACGGKSGGTPKDFAESGQNLLPDGGLDGALSENGQDVIDDSPESPNIPADGGGKAAEKTKTVSYIKITADGVNIRSGAGTGYSARGVAEKSALYARLGGTGGWVETGYRNGKGYISEKYCVPVEMETEGDSRIEAVISEGTKLLGTPYVYGAVRYHDGSGRLLKGFTADEFDCSSLMQYIFYKGADKLLQVNTRTQVLQGKEVENGELKRGDLMFFTNASRKNNKGIERIGHVALYLGGNYILHTASDYAKIEQVSELRWSYFICARRVIC